tara:strand:- start:2064 stop:3479 length:1416 start_codon:yes stop_codon:yes gene_type:complete
MAYLGIDPKVAYSSYRNIDDISASFDGFVTNFPLRVGGVAPSILPINEQQLLINIGGVPQQPDPSGANGFRLVAGNIVFSSAPSIGETFWGVILATANYISANTRFAAGSASLPSVTFASDVTTGIYSPGAGQLAISAGGTGELVVTPGGIQVTNDVQATSYNGGPLAGTRNRIINGDFDIWQRGTSFTDSEYGADRWFHARTGSTHTATRQPFTLGQTAVPNEPTYFCRTVVSSVAGASNYAALAQRIEDVRTFAGQQVTISFWAKADATKNIAINLIQSFGTGGSPSAGVSISGTKVSIGIAWQKVTVTANVPSISGKTLGSNNDSLLQLTIWFEAGSSFNTETNSLGQQSGTFEIAQVQVEPGPVATPFEQRPIGQELVLAKRYFEVLEVTGFIGSGYAAGAFVGNYVTFSVEKRVPPVLTPGTAIENFNLSSTDLSTVTSIGFRYYGAVTAAGQGYITRQVTAYAEL